VCIICLDFKRNKLTIDEAYQNLSEMEESIPEEHYDEVLEMLNKSLEAEASFFGNNEDDDKDLDIFFGNDLTRSEELDSLWNDDEQAWLDYESP